MQIELRPSYSAGTTVFGEPDNTIQLTLARFFKGEKGDPGDPGPPGSSGAGYVFSQRIPSSVWTINHNLGLFPNVYVLDTAGDECEGQVRNPSLNTTVITFSAALAGTARLL